MTCTQRFILRRIFRDLFAQSPHHIRNTEDVFGLIIDAWAQEFTEDNHRGRAFVLGEAFYGALEKAKAK